MRLMRGARMADDKSGVTWNDPQPVLAVALITAFVVVIFCWMFRPPSGDGGSIAVLNTLVGTLGGMTMMAVGFYFNSTKGSQGKDTTIATLATNASSGAAPVLPAGTTSTTTTTAAPATSEPAPTTTTTTAPPSPAAPTT